MSALSALPNAARRVYATNTSLRRDFPRLRSGTGLHAQPYSPAHYTGRIKGYVSVLTVADDGDAKPELDSGSEALRFVCFSCIASRVSQALLHSPGAKVFAGRFSEGVLSLVKQTEAVLLQSSAKIFPEPDAV
jgi:hypothetical protein